MMFMPYETDRKVCGWCKRTDEKVHGLQKERTKELEARVEALLNERDVLKGRVQQLKVICASSEGMQSPVLPCHRWQSIMASTHH